MKRISNALAALVLLVTLTGCSVNRLGVAENTTVGSGNIVSEDRALSGIEEVVLSTVGTLLIEQNGRETLTLEGDDNILPLITTEVTGKRLLIATKPGASFTTDKGLTYRLSVKNLSYVGDTASGDVKFTSLNAERLTLEASSAGNIRADGIQVRECTVKVTGSGTIYASGSAQEQDATLSGSGSYRAEDLESASAVVTTGGSGSATIRVLEMLDATVSGSGNIRYIGSPEVRESDNGSGSITQQSK